MVKQNPAIHRFYRSDTWKMARAIKIASAGGCCEVCGDVGTEVHHIIHLTPQNVSDPNISINQSTTRNMVALKVKLNIHLMLMEI